MKSIISRIVLCLLVLPVFAEISFHDPDINAKNEVLFSIESDIPGAQGYRTLFMKGVDTGVTDQLTFYPEAIESLAGGRVLQIRNRFGTGRYDTRGGSFSWVEDKRPFALGGSIGLGMIPEVSVSPDGRWLVSVEPVTPSRGRMVLFDVQKSVRYILADSVERGEVPVSWSPDSTVMVYSVSGTLYFARPESFFSVSSVDEKYRVLGTGSVNCVSWYGSSRLLYISGVNVYRIQTPELFARSLYSPLIGVGELAGKLSCAFLPSTDSFCASPDGSAILHARDNRCVQYAPLKGDDYIDLAGSSQFPWLLLPGNTARIELVWTTEGVPVVFASSVEDGVPVMKAWRLSDIPGGKVFTRFPVPAGTTFAKISHDGASIAFVTPTTLSVYSTASWKELAEYRDERAVSAAWADDSNLFIGGNETVRRWNFRTGVSELLLVSSVNASGWDEQGLTVIGDTLRLGRLKYDGKMKWTQTGNARIRPASGANPNWRLYTDSGKGYYSNMLYVRSAGSPAGTRPLVFEPEPRGRNAENKAPGTAAPAKKDSPGSAFSNGSRTAHRQVALVFDAMDDIDGLPEILHVLAQYRVRATFFINGEFIRRNPAAVNEIVKAGHQAASLFYTTWDLTGTQYRIDEDFIVRGLARNEDDFYNATGQELTLLWHAPHYVTSPTILSAGTRAGYRYVAGDVTVPDWATAEQERLMPGIYRGSTALIEDIMRDVKPGSIVPVRIGRPEGTRSDYLHDRIEILVNALIEDGYDIVTVDTLIQGVR